MLATADRMGTVPALRIDGERVKTNREIARFLDERPARSAALPRRPGPAARGRGSGALGRRGLSDGGAPARPRRPSLHGPDALVNRGSDGRLGPLLWRSQTVRLVGGALASRSSSSAPTRAPSRSCSRRCPPCSTASTRWIEAGVLNGDELYAADFMIAPSLALLCYRRDLRPEIERRPAMRLVDRVLPEPVDGDLRLAAVGRRARSNLRVPTGCPAPKASDRTNRSRMHERVSSPLDCPRGRGVRPALVDGCGRPARYGPGPASAQIVERDFRIKVPKRASRRRRTSGLAQPRAGHHELVFSEAPPRCRCGPTA